MKKRLFAVVMVVSVYVLFVLVFTAADSQGHISQFFSEIGLSDNSAITSSTSQLEASSTDDNLNASIRRPMPKPKRPAPPDYK